MATWGGYFSSMVKKKSDPVSESKTIAPGSTADQVQPIAQLTESNASILAKATDTKQSSLVIESTKKLYDLNTTADSKNEKNIPKSTSNAARVAKMFGYASPAASIASVPSVTSAKIEPATSITPTKEGSEISQSVATPVNSIPFVRLTGIAAEADSMAQETTVNQETKNSLGLVPWIFGAKSERPMLGSKGEKLSAAPAIINEKFTTTASGLSKTPTPLDAEARGEGLMAAPIIRSLKEPFNPSDLTRSDEEFLVNENLTLSTNVKPVITGATNLSRPVSITSSSSASTRWNQSSGFSSPVSRRDSVYSRVSSFSTRPFEISKNSIEEQVARDLRLQAEKENSMKYLALTRSIEQMRAERESMDSERMRMINEEELLKRNEVELKEKDEQMRKFIADVEREQEIERERDAAEARTRLRQEQEQKEREQRELEIREEEETRKREREEREQRELEIRKEEETRRRENEQRELEIREEEETRRREREEREQRESDRREEEEIRRREREEREQRESEKKQREEKMVEYERKVEEKDNRKREKDSNELQYSPTFDGDDNMKIMYNRFEEQLPSKIQNKFIQDDDDFSIYDDYYEEEMDRNENDFTLPNSKINEQDYRSKQEQLEEEVREEELKRQRSLQNSRLRQEEEERRRYAEEQAQRNRRNERGLQQQQIQAGSPLNIRPQVNSQQTSQLQVGQTQMGQPRMGPPQMGSPRMGPSQMGSPRMGPSQMGSPRMSPSQMGSPRMGQPRTGPPQMSQPRMGPPQMGQPRMGPPQMGQPRMGPPQMGQPRMGPPQMGQPRMGPPQMGQPRMGPPQMGQPQMGSPRMRPTQMGPSQMGSPQNRLPRIDQSRNEQQQIIKSQQDQIKGDNIQRQRDIDELETQEEKEQNIRKAELKMRQAFAEMAIQKGQMPQPTGPSQIPGPQTPIRTVNPNIVRPVGGLPAGPRARKTGF